MNPVAPLPEEKTVRFGYSSSSNITFKGTVDSGITRADWEEMSENEREESRDGILWELVELFELADDEPDYTGRWGR